MKVQPKQMFQHYLYQISKTEWLLGLLRNIYNKTVAGHTKQEACVGDGAASVCVHYTARPCCEDTDQAWHQGAARANASNWSLTRTHHSPARAGHQCTSAQTRYIWGSVIIYPAKLASFSLYIPLLTNQTQLEVPANCNLLLKYLWLFRLKPLP